ncbi:MAG: APC family permease [Phenylobacterium sp.]
MTPSASVRPTTAGPRELLRVLGVGFGVAVVIGGAVGQGILRTPGIVAGALPSPVWILAAWLAVGLLCFLEAFSTVELAASVPHAGGPYAFVRRAFGPTAGTLIGWCDWLNAMVTVGFLGVVFAEYVQRLGFAAGTPIGLLGPLLIAAVWLINVLGTRTSGLSQHVGTMAKALVLLAIVAVCLAAPAVHAPAIRPPPVLTLAALAVAVRAIYNTYAGWNSCVYFCEEVHEPGRSVARSIFLGLAGITALYVLVNAGLLHVLSVQQIAGSKLPAADAVAQVLGPRGGALTTAFAVISVAAIANVTVMYSTRIAFGMARHGVLPAPLARVGRAGTPQIALLATVIGGAACAATGVYETLIQFGAVFSVAINIGLGLSAIRLRRTEPHLDRPFRMPLFPLPPVVALLINSALLIAIIREDMVHGLLAVLALAAIAAAYAIGHRRVPAGSAA